MELELAVSALNALAHKRRLAAYRLLVEAGSNGLPAGTIAKKLRLPPSSLTFHLQQLLHTGLATQRRASQQIIYAADFAAMNALVGYLIKNCTRRGPRRSSGLSHDPSAVKIARNRRYDRA